MPLSRTSTASGRSRSRSPAQPPPPVLQSPRQYLPPSHYAEAGGLTASEKGKYNKDNNSEQHWQGAPRSKHAAYLSPRSTASNDAIEFQSNSPQSNSRSPESRQKRESQILNLPLVESQLLPSLRDTIDRMTRPPSRAHSKAGPTTPTFKISSEFDSVWPVATSRPHTPQCHLTLKHTSEESLSVSEPSTPKPTHSTPKSVLKSALRSPNPRGKPEHTEVVTSPSGSGVTLKSVRSLLRRKSSALGTIESPTKVEFKENKPPESFSVVRAPGRSRSRTDPGSRTPTIKSSEDVPIPLPNTPQPTSSYESRSFTSNIPRLRGNHSGGSRSASADDSDLEYRLELEARQYRRLTVINAKIPSCTSSSESEVESIVLSPATDLGEQGTTGERIVGLGLDFMDLKRNADMDLDVHETTTKHFSMNTYASAGSIYTDEETEESVFDTGIDPTHQSSQSLASLDTNHNRRRETLLGLVRGLHRYHTPQHPVMSGDESEYNGEPGLAISSSGDVQITSVNTGVQEDRITQVEELESEVEQEGFENETNLEGPSHRLSRNPAHGLSFGRRPGQFSPLPFKPSNSPKTETESKRPNKSSGLIDGNPLKATATSSSKRKTSRHEHGSRSQANPPSPRNLVPQPQPVVRDSFNSFESVVIAKKSREAVARGREAFGIPPSESDEVYHASPISNSERQANVATLPHIDSVGSNIDGDSWDNDKNNGQLSVGAEALFREIGGDCGGGRWDAKGKVDTGKRPSSTKLNSDEVEPHRKSTDRTHSRTVSPSRDDHSQTREGNSVNNHRQREIPSRGLWRSTISSSTYSSLLRQHGEREMKRQEIIWELYRSELDFVEKLGSVVKFFILPLRIQNSKTWISGVPLEISKIFDWLEDIVTLHTQIRDTLTGIQAAKRPVVDFVAESLHGLVHKLEIYQPYLVKIDGVSVMLQRLLNDLTSDFGEFVTIQENKIGDENRRLKNVLQEPAKRLELYPDIFKRERIRIHQGSL
ncbi:hypothetical protein E1B28_003174 [Marasmius oreades]|uniref:DH domain-containing protein n=1 Tax=Marasmius oreades TaxID=181124 RepID=A0A9P7RLN5_9AGAR|nr:uncharacterized protein E1B28_003174 [Marasmius oreades]KAG7085627.1 hypothetical protein E1B28_003174 [Marasmius oreades]